MSGKSPPNSFCGKKLSDTSYHRCGTSPATPLIQVTDAHVQHNASSQNGYNNPVFTFEDEAIAEEVAPEQSVRFRSNSLFSYHSGHIADLLSPRAKKHSHNESSDNVTRKSLESNTLAVPGAKHSRRHSVGVSSDSTLSSSSVQSLLQKSPKGSGLRINVDQLHTPKFPARLLSPGVKSMVSTWSEFVQANKRHSISSEMSNVSSVASFSGMSSVMSERIRSLIRAFSRRTRIVKEKAMLPPTPSSTPSSMTKSAVSGTELELPVQRHRLNSFIPGESRLSGISGAEVNERYIGCGKCRLKVPSILRRCKIPKTFDPNGYAYLFWLFLVTMAFMYNATVIFLRATFPYQTESNLVYWLICDYVADFLYLVDIVGVKMRLKYVKSGMIEEDPKEARSHYFRKIDFKLDVLSLLPLDLFYIMSGVNPLLRLPRVLKTKTFWEFYDRCDRVAKNAHVVRIMRTMTYMLYLIHIETCGYYAVSSYKGLNSTRWVYDGKGTAYIRCFYLATKTATSIGNNPKPTDEMEWIFMIAYWLSGVFVFALLIGQIRDIFQAANQAKMSFRKSMDATLLHMQNLNVPKELQHKVRTWFNYTWDTQKTLDENSLLSYLPQKMITDIAISVHFDTLSKVQLFQDCDKNLLFDLVSKLKPVLYLPGDNIITKGEVGTEMYIVVHGLVEVVAPTGQVLATLGKGSVFGEISLLALVGGNRRTATVRSKGFSNVFTLSKADFERAMKDYPEAQTLLKKRAKKLLAFNAKTLKQNESKIEVEEIIKTPKGTPKLLKTVIKVVDPDSKVAKWLHGPEGEQPNMTTSKGKTNQKLKAKNSLPKQNSLKRNSLPLGNHLQSVSDNEDEDGDSFASEELDVLGAHLSDDENEEFLIIEQTEIPIKSQQEIETKAGTPSVNAETGETILVDESVEDEINRLLSQTKTPDINPLPSEIQKSVSSPLAKKETPSSGKSSGKSIYSVPGSGKNKRRSKTSLNSPLTGSPFGTPFKKKNSVGPLDDIMSSAKMHSADVATRPKSVVDFSKALSNRQRNQEKRDNSDEDDLVPLENKILCSVEIHREKSTSSYENVDETQV